MNEVLLKLKRGPSNRLSGLAVEDGSLIITNDKHQLFFDVGSDRVSLGPDMATDEDVTAMFNGEAAKNGDEVVTTINGSDEVNFSEF